MVEPSTYPTQAELLSAENIPYWIDRRFLRRDPFAFQNSTEGFHEIACTLAEALGTEPNGIFCVGSGAVGLSINPKKITGADLKRFGSDSDIDIAIISSFHFEGGWREILRMTQPHLEEIPAHVAEHLDWQRKRIFDGAILANKLLGSLSFGRPWIGAIDRMGGVLSSSLDQNVDVKAWIFRDYWSLRNYMAKGIVDCRNKLRIMET